LEELLRLPNCPLVLYMGKKKLIKRRAFDIGKDLRGWLGNAYINRGSDRDTSIAKEEKSIHIHYCNRIKQIYFSL